MPTTTNRSLTVVVSAVRFSSPLDYTFVTLGDDWPTTDSDEPYGARDDKDHAKRSIRNPLRRAAEWARRVRRRL